MRHWFASGRGKFGDDAGAADKRVLQLGTPHEVKGYERLPGFRRYLAARRANYKKNQCRRVDLDAADLDHARKVLEINAGRVPFDS